MSRPPCKGCEFRKAGCHSPAVCPKWAAHIAAKDAEEVGGLSSEDRIMLKDYIKDRGRRYLPRSWRGKRR